METTELLEAINRGEDRRHQLKVTAREEMQRMFQRAQLVYGDDVPVPRTSISDIDVDYFRRFFRKRFDRELDEQGLSIGQVLTNMRLLNGGLLTVSGALLFASGMIARHRVRHWLEPTRCRSHTIRTRSDPACAVGAAGPTIPGNPALSHSTDRP